HMQNSSAKDLAQYLSASFVVIFLDECGQFPGEVWEFMSSRNRVNPQCRPDESGAYPQPCMLGATNPIGANWGWYKAQFVDKEPYERPEGARKDKNGRYWVNEA